MRSFKTNPDKDKYEGYKCPDRINSLGLLDKVVVPHFYESGVRPALKVSDHDAVQGQRYGYGYNKWTYIGDDYLLSDYIVSFQQYGKDRFGLKKQWYDSDLNEWLQDFSKKQKWI